MNVLVINCGSSSLKFQLRSMDGGPSVPGLPAAEQLPASERMLAAGRVQGIGGEAELTFRRAGHDPEHSRRAVPDHLRAAQTALDWLRAGAAPPAIDAVGHRFVHGGERLHRPVRIDAAVREELRALLALAPLHNGPAFTGLEAVQAVLGPKTPQVAVFDTAFHHALPDVARHYGLPHALAEKHGIRRYGFHGTSCRSVLERYAALPEAVPEARVIVLHLGSGCSATAVRAGQAVDTSMGFTPLEGLLMGTRSGDLDPALPAFLARREGLSPEQVEHLLNHESGLKGVSGLSADLRVLLAQEAQHPRARLAVELFCYRVRKFVGAYLAVLQGAEAVLFTGGVGEHLASIRERICGPLAWCGLLLDPQRNDDAQGDGNAADTLAAPTRISQPGGAVQAYVISSDEERIIAGDTAQCLS